jgi:predicted GH43/DUF377 family glycosyl hydrolase
MMVRPAKSTAMWLAFATLTAVVLVAAATRRAEILPIDDRFPLELVEWVPHGPGALFEGTGQDTWDRKIRERGFILAEPDGWKLWYTGYDWKRGGTKALGLATSADGTNWTRHPGNPVFADTWTEDMFVVKHDGIYHMFAEGQDDIAHRLASLDGVRWEQHGPLDIRTRSGAPLPGPYGTPVVLVEDGTWYLFYEIKDKGVWLATSTDQRVWTNVQDEPVIKLGPQKYDRHAIALNQVVRYGGRYYALYTANGHPQWKGPWTTSIAVSDDLVQWEKYAGNPIIRSDDSSAILVEHDGELRLYSMHPVVREWRRRVASR